MVYRRIMAPPSRLVVHGARGSLPASGTTHTRYGGNSTCFSLHIENTDPIVIDCGTGMAFAPDLVPEGPTHYHVFLTHYHLDHLVGLQGFRPFFQQDQRFTFYGYPAGGIGVDRALLAVFTQPWFPIPLEEIPSRRDFVELDGTPARVGPVAVTTIRLRHPQGITGYRLEVGGRAIVIATDHEAGEPEVDARLVEFATGADVLIHDAQFTPEEREGVYSGWGHSTWHDAATTADAAGVDRLILTSHDPFRSDDDIDAIVAAAKELFPNVEAAHEGMVLAL